ncbi:hypothetical protein [Streptomyces hygroscopicus]|uniref:hypothetical protein n=1 Tax=Streptomyces hygroscopicus TaxID=1912 RepID=UPI0033CAB2E3
MRIANLNGRAHLLSGPGAIDIARASGGHPPSHLVSKATEEYRKHEPSGVRQSSAHPGRLRPCHQGFEPSPDTYTTSAATHRLAA